MEMEEEDEQLFLFQVTAENIVITDRSCLSEADGTDLVYVKVLYPGLNWIELDQVDFCSLQEKPQPKEKDSSASMNKVQSSQIFFSKENIVCNEGKSFLISMRPKALLSHLTTSDLQITLYQGVLIDEPWVIASHETKMSAEMSRLVEEALRHPDLREGPAAMDKQFPLNGAFGQVCGFLQCTLCLSCAGPTAEFALRNACYVRDTEDEEGVHLEDEIVDVERASVDTVAGVDVRAPLPSQHSKVARLLKADDPFTYFKGVEVDELVKSDEYLLGGRTPSNARQIPDNNSTSLLPEPRAVISATTCDTCRGGVFSSIDDVTLDDVSDDRRKLSILQISDILNEMLRKSDKSPSKPHRELSFSTISDITVSTRKTKSQKLRTKSEEKSGEGFKRTNFERHSLVNFNLHGPIKLLEPSEQPKPVHSSHDTLTSLMTLESELCHMDSKEDFSLSIVKHASVYHVSIKNSANQLDNVLKFKIYGNDVTRKRPRENNSVSVTVVPTRRES
ncbi:unnamed protein product [Bemisia tabaci]|uniref:Uncharacterized protein n=1 Tax=Bemisia tabaci TaxID=7038 RepID=A0A9P0G2K1_BEMTA|nr:unnamed protein product [Bemisia tabaci]